MTFEHDFGWSLPPGCTTLPGEEPIPSDWKQCSNCEEFEPPEDVKDEICKHCGKDCANCGERYPFDDLNTVTIEGYVMVCEHCMDTEMATPPAPLPID